MHISFILPSGFCWVPLRSLYYTWVINQQRSPITINFFSGNIIHFKDYSGNQWRMNLRTILPLPKGLYLRIYNLLVLSSVFQRVMPNKNYTLAFPNLSFSLASWVFRALFPSWSIFQHLILKPSIHSTILPKVIVHFYPPKKQ